MLAAPAISLAHEGHDKAKGGPLKKEQKEWGIAGEPITSHAHCDHHVRQDAFHS